MKNLFIVGAQRSGSTYLYEALDDHPQISMAHPVRPEPKFFLNERLFEHGRDLYENNYFNDRKSGSLYLGEKSTSYIESIEAAQRIHAYYPDARILMILRNPIQRAYSNYLFSVAHKLETLTFMEALKAESERLNGSRFSTSVNPYAYRQRGRYIDYIESYVKVFSPSQLCVLIFEEFVNNLAGVRALYRWLEIDDNFTPKSLDKVVNPSTIKKEVSSVVFRELALGYDESILALERYLGRKVDVWRKQNEKMSGGLL